jgi:hypothetical protein
LILCGINSSEPGQAPSSAQAPASSNRAASTAPDSAIPSAPAASAEQEPPFANVTVRAYDLTKDPYSYKGEMITLDVSDLPVLYNGSVIQYRPTALYNPALAAQLGLMAVRFNKMMSEDIALYDVLGWDAQTSVSETQMLGQIAVVLMPGQQRPEASGDWDVEPMGVLDGTDGFGAEIQVPEVRFWRYEDLNSRPGRSTPAAPESPSPTGPSDLSSYANQLRAVVVGRGFTPVGNAWFLDADSEGDKLLIQRADCDNTPGGALPKAFHRV